MPAPTVMLYISQSYVKSVTWLSSWHVSFMAVTWLSNIFYMNLSYIPYAGDSAMMIDKCWWRGGKGLGWISKTSVNTRNWFPTEPQVFQSNLNHTCPLTWFVTPTRTQNRGMRGFPKTLRSAIFCLRSQPRNFANIILAARQRVHFRVFWFFF